MAPTPRPIARVAEPESAPSSGIAFLGPALLENGTEDEKASAGDHRHGVHPATCSGTGWSYELWSFT
jgi:hypothetical protein